MEISLEKMKFPKNPYKNPFLDEVASGFHDSWPFLESLFDRGGLGTESFAAKLFETGNFNPSSAYSSSRLLEDLGDPKLGELLYSD
jgi:hypothetical protein